MSFDLAQRLTEILLALAFLQQSAEHLAGPQAARAMFLTRAALCLPLLAGIQSDWMLLALSIQSIAVLHRYNGPYNGGSDRMGLLVLYCLTLSHWLPAGYASHAAFGYLGVQVILSYFISGIVKLANPAWRNGHALRNVFAFSAYPVAENLRALQGHPRLLQSASWGVIAFEVAFPLSLASTPALLIALPLATAFHLANAVLFGLNRFVWFWLAAYPSILWLQPQVLAAL